MAKFRLNAKSYFDQAIKLEDGSTVAGVILDAGTVVDYDGIPGTNMDPVDAAADAVHAKALRARRDGLRPRTKEQEFDDRDENPMLDAEDQRLARQYRREQQEKEAHANELGKIEVRKIEQPAPERNTLHAPHSPHHSQGKPNR